MTLKWVTGRRTGLLRRFASRNDGGNERKRISCIIRLPANSEFLGQLVRFALTGGLASIVNIGVYWALAAGGMDPNLAWAAGFVAAVVVGYTVHSRWSFRGHGRRDNLARTSGRFLVVGFVGFGLNMLWVWLLVQRLGLPLWAPYPLVLGVTPLATFALNRQWVFR